MYLTWLALVALELWVFWLTTLKESEAYWLYGAENRYSDAALYWRPVIQKAYYGIFWLHIWLVGAWVLAFLKRSVYQRTPYSGQIIWLSWFLVFVGSWNTLNLISDNLLEWITKG